MPREYGFRSAAYLARARAALDDQAPPSLFYAAFELRCGIEARMREYLEFQEHISRKKREGWRIAVLGQSINAAFDSAETFAKYTFYDRKSGRRIGSLFYKPVSPALRNAAQRLGDLLHAQREYHEPEDLWWNETRAFLEETFRELEWSVSGELLGPPIQDAQGHISIHAVVEPDGPLGSFAAGGKIRVEVEYPEARPLG